MTMAYSSLSAPRIHGNSSQNFVSPVDPRWLSYELRKEAWAATHPRATPTEYARAMLRICRELGV